MKTRTKGILPFFDSLFSVQTLQGGWNTRYTRTVQKVTSIGLFYMHEHFTPSDSKRNIPSKPGKRKRSHLGKKWLATLYEHPRTSSSKKVSTWSITIYNLNSQKLSPLIFWDPNQKTRRGQLFAKKPERIAFLLLFVGRIPTFSGGGAKWGHSRFNSSLSTHKLSVTFSSMHLSTCNKTQGCKI